MTTLVLTCLKIMFDFEFPVGDANPYVSGSNCGSNSVLPSSERSYSGIYCINGKKQWKARMMTKKNTTCKTQNSGLHPKEEKPNRANQWTSPADATCKRVYCRLRKPGDSDLLGGRAPRTANWASFYGQKNPHYQHITYGLQSDWLHVCKAILLVQTSRATCLQSNSIGTTSPAFVQT